MRLKNIKTKYQDKMEETHLVKALEIETALLEIIIIILQ